MALNILPKKSNLSPDIQIIPEYLEIRDLITNQKSLIFVTGGAGTGKSTMIKWIMEEFSGMVLLSAPTAVAALNIGGKTLHSLCLLPPAWVVEDDIKEVYYRKDVKKAKILVIDEISMVNANILDAVDSFFQVNRRNTKPFGGLITIMVGDLFQIPPVISKDVKELFDEYYDSPWFFSANCIKDNVLKTIRLKKTFRQKDNTFVDMLLNVRKGEKVQETLEYFNTKCSIINNPDVGVVRMCPRNAQVDKYNLRELNKLDTPARKYTGEIRGNFKKDALPSPMDLLLKVGAQVMFNQNDMNKKWINGTIGEVTKMDDNIIDVKLFDTGEIVQVAQSKWADYKYTWNEGRKKVQRDEAGSYVQFPLMLAWACTIHKSQGKTIKNIFLDLGSGAFATGQTYVALSRCPTVEGIALSRCIEDNDVLVSDEIKDFYYNTK